MGSECFGVDVFTAFTVIVVNMWNNLICVFFPIEFIYIEILDFR